MLLRCVGATAALALACAVTGCNEATSPAAPALDIRGQYDVVWRIGFNQPDGDPAVPDSSVPRGECPATVVIQYQTSSSFRGTTTIPDGVRLPCHAARLQLAGTMRRVYAGGENSYDYGWDLFVTSDVESLLNCTFAARAPGNTGRDRGVGRIDPAGHILLAFSNIYDCGDDQWWIVAGADGAQSGS
jgi:hypothetical protein